MSSKEWQCSPRVTPVACAKPGVTSLVSCLLVDSESQITVAWPGIACSERRSALIPKPRIGHCAAPGFLDDKTPLTHTDSQGIICPWTSLDVACILSFYHRTTLDVRTQVISVP